ncbi:MAG: alanine racemase [Pseudomonadota bacterium]
MSFAASAVIHRDHLRHNLGVVRAARPGARVMAMVKANAYGHGLVEVARALSGADSLAVARPEEAEALRAAGVDTDIVLLEGVFDAPGMATADALGCELVVHTPEQIALLAAHRADARFTVWLKVDSGMNRLGFPVAALNDAERALRDLPQVAELRLMSHYASADAGDGEQLAEQRKRLASRLARFEGAVSLANSPAALRAEALGDDAPPASDWIRPGVALYGVSPFAGVDAESLGLKPVMDFETRLIAVRDLVAGDRVGYGGRYTAKGPMRLGIAAAGYGDGYPRRMPDGTPVLVDGQGASIAGRVSMDMLGIDVTQVPNAHVGSTVRLWGAGLPAETVAQACDTIAYELVTRVSERVTRIYL